MSKPNLFCMPKLWFVGAAQPQKSDGLELHFADFDVLNLELHFADFDVLNLWERPT